MINQSHAHSDQSFFDFNNLVNWTVRAGPRIIIIGLVGYASLGWAYEAGLMAAIDRIAIPILRNHVGYFGLGAIMPTFQWYAAWAVRITAALTAETIFELILLICRKCLNCLFPGKPSIPQGAVPLPGMVN